ncbi:hypothetical protein S7711_04410 [Stachybotrys chartarum IBT 7711]|uniref:Uncharacterized protein n=1 Tax=Stachybotrys chartarum (strain CBS 109288 / IBT 7711) TaxID=1280523 RepID=A0A084B5J2_STACB|nr:hypothetical protein S7711_04410 [Stachybotrys chartarum IBT 7711]
MSNVPAVPLVCANWGPDASTCNNKARYACNNCHLVVYCGKNCQRDHWQVHKTACRSAIGKASWRPAWELEDREPAWNKPEAAGNLHNTFGGETYLWGNTPAIDVLQLQQNEGLQHGKDIALLFAASGDLRNVVKTIVDLPTNVSQRVEVTINDREFAVVALNAIWLLLALTWQETAPASNLKVAESLIHLWYSVFIPAELYAQLRDNIKPLITKVCVEFANEEPSVPLEKTWNFQSGRTLSLALTKGQWLKLEALLDMPETMSFERASSLRIAVTLAPERADFRDRWDFKEATPFTRVAKQRYREDGLVLPFGHPRTGFDTPNPVVFQSSERWLMDDKRDPLDGWPVSDVRRKQSVAVDDCYGELFAYLQDTFGAFLSRLGEINVDFEIHCLDVKELPEYLGKDRYTRIECANIADAGYVRIGKTLSLLSSLLQSPRQNPHATLITVFLNAVWEIYKMGADSNGLPNARLLMEYLPIQGERALSPNSADMLRIWDARSQTMDADKYFNEYRTLFRFDQVSAEAGVVEKHKNTVIEQWPMRLKLKRGQKGAQEEFRRLLGSNLTGLECYLEWKSGIIPTFSIGETLRMTGTERTGRSASPPLTSHDHVAITHAATAEIPAIVAFTKQARADMFPMIDTASHNAQTARELSTFQATYIDSPGGAFLTARVNGILAATIAYVAYDGRFPYLDLGTARVVEVVRLYVDPALRRMGLASQLFVALKDEARRAGIELLYLHTHPFLPGAVTFWERHGFSVIHIDEDPVWRTTHMKLPLDNCRTASC